MPPAATHFRSPYRLLPALAAAVQGWLLTALALARYLVVASTREGVVCCCATAARARRQCARQPAGRVTVDSVCVSDGSDDVLRAAQLLQAAPRYCGHCG